VARDPQSRAAPLPARGKAAGPNPVRRKGAAVNPGVAIVVGLGLIAVGFATMGNGENGLDNLPRTALIIFFGIVLFVVGVVLAFVGH
jgi:hypothetical protein